MTFMCEVFHSFPVASEKERAFYGIVQQFGGKLQFREESRNLNTVVLTCEFETLPEAESATEMIRALGEHVEGPMDYGD